MRNKNMEDLTGNTWKFGNNIDTDIIIAARYLNSSDPQHLAKYVMEDSDIPNFASIVRKNDIIVAGENFGCGSSREHAPIALKAAGIGAIIAPTFARIFYRNAFNMGLAIFELKEACEINQHDNLTIKLDSAQIINNTQNKTYNFTPIPPFMQELLNSGGLMQFAKKEINEKL
jgi:3-isopropylmalate/(R)-2-methylmalate dehydratase small subunit